LIEYNLFLYRVHLAERGCFIDSHFLVKGYFVERQCADMNETCNFLHGGSRFWQYLS
jgi:hypothetical protein